MIYKETLLMAWSLGQCREWLGIRALHLSRTQELGWHALPKTGRMGQGGSCCFAVVWAAETSW